MTPGTGNSELPSAQQPSQEILVSSAEDTRAAFPEQDVQGLEFAPQRFVAWSKVQPLLRQWLESYRRSTEGLDTK
ncbi:hypothetical protein J437_LFUL004587 [Ladona fulva]|uniref:Uncharacterized protein n=1 Tax=Ladona fulva TaxID=123851 RepID=A0A8K0JUB3_LADFU|nr:hypothetical protein J437_LFUL004587 [Ladona fulva]